MNLESNTKYRLSQNGGADQVILVCHGGWSTADGKIFVPKGMVVHFYSAHGQFGTRAQAISEKMLGANTAVGLSQETMIRIIQQAEREKWNKDQIDLAMLQAKGDANAQDMGESMQIVESVTGKGLGQRQKVYNYTLSYKGPRGDEKAMERLFQQHQSGALRQHSTSIDMMVLNQGIYCHLESAIKFAKKKGDYTQFHFLPCRWVDDKDLKSMRTVHLPDFGGEDFIETSVL